MPDQVEYELQFSYDGTNPFWIGSPAPACLSAWEMERTNPTH